MCTRWRRRIGGRCVFWCSIYYRANEHVQRRVSPGCPFSVMLYTASQNTSSRAFFLGTAWRTRQVRKAMSGGSTSGRFAWYLPKGCMVNVLTVVFFLTFQWLVFCATVRRVRMVLCFSGWCSILQCEMVSFFSGWCSMLQCEGMCESIMFQCELFHVQCEKWCHDSA